MGRNKLNVKKYMVLLNESDLFAAQVVATKNGVNQRITGNNSAFLRWLLENYLKEYEK